MRGLLGILAALATLPSLAGAATPPGAPRAHYVADTQCAACHPRQAAAWKDSKHALAMQPATPATVQGDFNDTRFAAPGETARFFRRDSRLFINTIGADGKAADFPVSHAFGLRPLQQLLIPQPGGRLQAFTVAWDTRQKRWFSLHPEGALPPGSPLHWSGRFQNWNLMCGECHTTAYRKGYNDTTDTYRSTWATGHVGCQACHGPGKEHADSARQPGKKPTPTPNGALASAHGQVDQCATCHARRTRIVEEAAPGKPLFDSFIPDTLRAGLYHPDGQQLDEVFEYGSFRQSRMYQAGVACADCHEPHGGQLRASGNALCVRCHSPAPDPRFPGLQAKNYDAPAHHGHAAGQPGSQCVDCHMPTRDYMVVHARRDHAIRIPRPDLTRRIGTPNACQGCHADKPTEWAEAAIEKRHGAKDRLPHYGEVIAAARAGQPGATARLAALIGDAAQPAIVRATAIETLASLGAPPPATAFADPDPAVRTAVAAALSIRPAAERLAHLPPLLADPLRAVRITAARGLADIPADLLGAGERRLRDKGIAGFIAAQQAMADMPSAQVNLAQFYLELGKPVDADRHYSRAIAQLPAGNDARLALARLLVDQGRGEAATQLLRDGVAASSQPGPLHFALGLIAGKAGRWAEAAAELERAASLMPDDPRVRRNLEAVRQRLPRQAPGNPPQ